MDAVGLYSQRDAIAKPTPPRGGKIPVRVERDGKAKQLVLDLPMDWRRRDEFAWRYSFNDLKAKLLGLDELSGLTDAERAQNGIHVDESSARIGRVLRARRGSGVNAAARESGLRAGDIILRVDGRGRDTESEMLAYVLQGKHPGEEVELTVLRGGRRLGFSFAIGRDR